QRILKVEVGDVCEIWSQAIPCASSSAIRAAERMLARIDGVVNQMQQELDEVRAFSDHCGGH
ncbi:unnamed protein product, partial [Effrenium voratum]